MMRRARPSAMAVLPTPASPTSSGLFLRRRHSVWMTRSSSLSRPISGSILPVSASWLRFCVKLSSALALLLRFGFLLGGFLALAGRLRCLGDAVGNEVHHVEARDPLLLQEVHRVGILLAENRHQHIGAGHLLLAGGLHMQDGALDDALEAEGRLGVDLAIAGDGGRVLVDEVGNFAPQLLDDRRRRRAALRRQRGCRAAPAAGARR